MSFFEVHVVFDGTPCAAPTPTQGTEELGEWRRGGDGSGASGHVAASGRDPSSGAEQGGVSERVDVDGPAVGVGRQLNGPEGILGPVVEAVGVVQGVHRGAVVGPVETNGDDAFDGKFPSLDLPENGSDIVGEVAVHNDLTAVQPIIETVIFYIHQCERSYDAVGCCGAGHGLFEASVAGVDNDAVDRRFGRRGNGQRQGGE